MGGKLSLVRDFWAFSGILLTGVIISANNLDDEQWVGGVELFAPVYLLYAFFLCGLFYLRHSFFAIISATGDVKGNLSVQRRKVASWLMFSLAFLCVGFTIWNLQVVVYAEDELGQSDYSTIDYADQLVINCKYNEECVAANVLNNSSVFSFLAPDVMDFEIGDSADYHDLDDFFVLPMMIVILWPSVVFWIWVYESIMKKRPTHRPGKPNAKWKDYYDGKSYRSYGAFLLCLTTILPALFIVTNKTSSLTVIGAAIVGVSVIMLYYLCLYFYSYSQNTFSDSRVSEMFAKAPLFGMLVISVVGLIYSIFMAPVENGNEIWLSDSIFGLGAEYGLFDSVSYRYSLANLLVGGLILGGVSAALIGCCVLVGDVASGAWVVIPALLGVGFAITTLVGATHIILAIYGFIAMIIIEQASFNYLWVSPLVLILSSIFMIMIQAEMENHYYRNSNTLLRFTNPPVAQTSTTNQQGAQNFLAQQGSTGSVIVKPKLDLHLYSSGADGVELLVPNPHTGENLTVMLGPTNPNSWWGSSASFWKAFTKKELILILKLFNLKTSGNKDILQDRCLDNIKANHFLSFEGSDYTTQYNPTTLTEMIALTENFSPPSVDQQTDLLGQNKSSKPNKKKSVITTDSSGITTIETAFSIVTLNKLTDEVTKVPIGTEQHEMFYQEIRNMKHLDSKGFDVGLIDYDDGSDPKIVTRYMGPSKLLEQYQTLSNRGKKKLIQNLVNRVGEIHKCGMVHRDLKPDNILIDARPLDGNHQFDAIIDFGIAMKINRKQSEIHNTAGTKFFGHSSQKDVNFNASTGQDWFSLARIFALILRGTSIDSLNAEIQMSLTGLDMRNEIQTLGFNDKVVDSMTELIIQSTKSSCEQHETVSKLARIGKEITKSL